MTRHFKASLRVTKKKSTWLIYYSTNGRGSIRYIGAAKDQDWAKRICEALNKREK